MIYINDENETVQNLEETHDRNDYQLIEKLTTES